MQSGTAVKRSSPITGDSRGYPGDSSALDSSGKYHCLQSGGKGGRLTQSCVLPAKNSNRNEDSLNYLENKAFLYIVKADTTDEANEKYV